jgi:NAD(P)-dependent dehydrogenase (short-subunit alcohol dehydrogenase family)
MNLNHSVAVVTGANRGLGRHLAQQLSQRGAKVYGAARRPEAVDLPGVVPLRLDLNDPESIAEAARTASDATLLVNNASVATFTPLISGDLEQIRLEMQTHYFGTLDVTRAFAGPIEANGGGTILNVLSVLSWRHTADNAAYCAGKAASWALTNAVREELRAKGIHVAALHVGYMDTDMAHFVPADSKVDPAKVAALALDGVEAGESEIIADDVSRNVKSQLSAPLAPAAS